MKDLGNSGVLPLAGQVALVTGSTQGIGAGICRTLAEHGARVIVHGRSRDRGEQMAATCRATGQEAIFVAADLREETQCRALMRHAVGHFGRLDVLVNSAGVVHRGNIENTSVELWDEIFAVNLRAPFVLCQEAVRHMRPRQSGCIINIGSVAAYVGLKKLLPYSASKGGLTTFTKNLANYLAPYRIRVNQINPGWVLTEGEQHVQTVVEGKDEHWVEKAVEGRPWGRLLSPGDVASAALFFATSELITGAVLDYEQLPVGAPQEV